MLYSIITHIIHIVHGCTDQWFCYAQSIYSTGTSVLAFQGNFPQYDGDPLEGGN